METTQLTRQKDHHVDAFPEVFLARVEGIAKKLLFYQ